MAVKCLLFLLAVIGLTTLCSARYMVEENGKACLLMDVTATFEIRYEMTNGSTGTVYSELPDDLQNYGGECMDMAETSDHRPAAEIKFTLPDKSILNVTFVEVTEEIGGENVTFTALNRVIYSLNTNDNPAFVTPVNPGPHLYVVDNLAIELHRKDHYYYCDEDLLFGLTREVLLTMHHLRVEAISVINNTYSQEGDKCIVPSTTPTTTTEAANTTIMTTTEETNTTITEITPMSTSEFTTNTTETTNSTTESTTTESTTSVPVTNSTEESVSSTRVTDVTHPMTTPVPKENFYYVDDGSTFCIIMNFNATFKITYTTKSGDSKTIDVPFDPSEAEASGTCGADKQSIVLTWRPASQPKDVSTLWGIAFYLAKDASNSDSYTFEHIISLHVLNNGTFPDLPPGDEGKPVTATLSTPDMKSRFKTPVGDVFRCTADEKVVVKDGGVEFDTKNFKVEGFRKSVNTDFSKNEVVCSEDNPASPKSSVVPIVIGVVLAVLVIIVLAAYFIGRRRARNNNNYQQLP